MLILCRVARVAEAGEDLASEWCCGVVRIFLVACFFFDLAGDEGDLEEFFEVEIQG